LNAALTVEKAALFVDQQTVFFRAHIPRDKFAQNPPVLRVRAKMTNGAPSLSVPHHLLSLLLFPEPLHRCSAPLCRTSAPSGDAAHV
jgi:hypothetical protein